MIYNLLNRNRQNIIPKASQVLECYLRQENFPLWTSYFIKSNSVVNDQFGKSYFIFNVQNTNHSYLILRTGCFPYMKYHCTKSTLIDNDFYQSNLINYQNRFINFIKILNLGKLTS
jgi:hypothetical protein